RRSLRNNSCASNTVLLNLCTVSINEYLTMVNSPIVIQFIWNSLDLNNAKTADCLNIVSGAA
ncbi:hypothetical protein DFQ27_009578, partial [Actinomortierella ambigua]